AQRRGRPAHDGAGEELLQVGRHEPALAELLLVEREEERLVAGAGSRHGLRVNAGGLRVDRMVDLDERLILVEWSDMYLAVTTGGDQANRKYYLKERIRI